MQRTMVIKVGGGKGIDLDPITRQMARVIERGERVVLVHGGSHETDVLSEKLGHPARTITSPSGHVSRRTDRATLEIFEMAYCGKINKSVVEMLRRLGVDSIGLSGIDGGLWRASRKEAIRSIEEGRVLIIRDDLSGKVESVDDGLLRLLLEAGRTPVLTPPAITDDGIAVNVDADRAAAATAVALRADELLLLSNVPGVLRDPGDPASVIESASAGGIEALREAALGRMRNKVLAAEEAIEGGVGRVVIGSALGDDAIERARQGAGTLLEGATA